MVQTGCSVLRTPGVRLVSAVSVMHESGCVEAKIDAHSRQRKGKRGIDLSAPNFRIEKQVARTFENLWLMLLFERPPLP